VFAATVTTTTLSTAAVGLLQVKSVGKPSLRMKTKAGASASIMSLGAG
jgi:hypothetical protein